MCEKKCNYPPTHPLPPPPYTHLSAVVGFFNSKLRRAADANQIINLLWVNLRNQKVCYIFGLCTFEIQAWILLTQIIVTTLYDYWVFVDSLKSLADKKALFYMNVSTIKTSMWMSQFNTTIISLVIASLFQIFSFYSLTCHKRYAAFT